MRRSRLLVWLAVALVVWAPHETAGGSGPLTAEENEQLQKTCGGQKPTDRFKVSCENGKDQCRQPKIGEFPWAVLLVTPQGRSSCSATLISQRHVLTAAHCFYKLSEEFYQQCEAHARGPDFSSPFDQKFLRSNHPKTEWRVAVGTNEGRRQGQGTDLKIQKVFMHEGWCRKPSGPVGTDLVVIELTEDAVLSDIVAPACLPKASDPLPDEFNITGFGLDAHRQSSSMRLLQTTLYRKAVPLDGTPGTFETSVASTDVCAGDSGGGLMHDDGKRTVVFGTVSQGPGCRELQNPRIGKTAEFLAKERKATSTIITDVRAHKNFICKVSGVCVGDEDEQVTQEVVQKEPLDHVVRRLLSESYGPRRRLLAAAHPFVPFR